MNEEEKGFERIAKQDMTYCPVCGERWDDHKEKESGEYIYKTKNKDARK